MTHPPKNNTIKQKKSVEDGKGKVIRQNAQGARSKTDNGNKHKKSSEKLNAPYRTVYGRIKLQTSQISKKLAKENKRLQEERDYDLMLATALGYIDTNEDKKRFEELYYTYRNLMYKAAFNILQNPQDPEDALQDAFINIAKNFSKISDIKCPQTKAFVVIIIRNISYNVLKKRKRRRETDTDIDELEIPDKKLQPDEAALDKYSVELLEKALQQLPSKYYDIIYLTSYMDYSIKEAANLLGISYDNAKKRLSRAKARFAAILEDNGYEQF